MAKKKAAVDAKVDRVIEVAFAARSCLRKLRLIGKTKLSKKEKAQLKACVGAKVGPK